MNFVIHNESCLDTMRGMSDKSIDLILTSPPYNMNLRIRNGKYCSRQIVKEISTKYEGFSDNLPIEEFYELHKKILSEAIRVSKILFYNIQIVTGSKQAFFKLIGDYHKNLKEVIVWDKGHGQPAMSPNVLNRRSELILVLESEDGAISRKFSTCNFLRGSMDDVWNIKRGRKISSSHGAVFPEELARKVIQNFTRSGDVVYDPFMGSGTTGKVALEEQRYFIGSEISERYCEISRKRMLGEVYE